MDNYKLTYLNLKGIAEPIRLLFKYVNVPFEDIQVEVTKWYDVKNDYKWQQLPYLEYNGHILTQTRAIGSFLGRKFNLVPEDIWDQAKCEEIIGAVEDLRLTIKPLVLAKYAGEEDRVKKLLTELLATPVPLFMGNIHELLEEIRKSKESAATNFILGGDKPTWEDFYLANITDQWTDVLELPDLLDKYPMLKKQQKAVYSLPGVAEWIAIRPKTFI